MKIALKVAALKRRWLHPLRVMVALVIAAVGLSLTSTTASASTVAQFSSITTGMSGQTQQFSISGPWSLAWTMGCYSGGVFAVTINGSNDVGPNELSGNGTTSGTDYYTDSGTFSLSVSSDCNWWVTISSNAPGPNSTPVTYTSQQTGFSGQTQQFTAYAPWSMAWSYNCSNYGSQGNFFVEVDGSSDIGPNELGSSGSGTDYYNDSGTFSLTVISECNWSVSISGSAPSVPPPTTSSSSAQHGYWLVGSDGGIFTFGAANFYGSTGALSLQRPVVGIVPTKDDGGYWLDASDGGVFSFGDTQFYGSIPGLGLNPAGSGLPNSLNAPIVGMVPSADDGGYFMVASDGGVFAFGDAHFAGSCPGIGGCLGAAVSVMPDASGNGYWLVTSLGYVYAFGDAGNYGSPGPQSVPVTSAVRTPDGGGYWILFANGAVAPYGDAGSYGAIRGQWWLEPVYGSLRHVGRWRVLDRQRERHCVELRRRSSGWWNERNRPQRGDHRRNWLLATRGTAVSTHRPTASRDS